MFLRALRVVQAREGGEEQGGDGAGARGLEAAGGGAARGVHRGGARRAGDGHQASCARAHTESTSNENVVTYVAVVDSPAGEYGVARQNND